MLFCYEPWQHYVELDFLMDKACLQSTVKMLKVLWPEASCGAGDGAGAQAVAADQDLQRGRETLLLRTNRRWNINQTTSEGFITFTFTGDEKQDETRIKVRIQEKCAAFLDNINADVSRATFSGPQTKRWIGTYWTETALKLDRNWTKSEVKWECDWTKSGLKLAKVWTETGLKTGLDRGLNCTKSRQKLD